MLHQTNFIDRVKAKDEHTVSAPRQVQPEPMPRKEKLSFFQAFRTEIFPLLSQGVWMVAVSVTVALPAMLWMDVKPAHAVIFATIFILAGMAVRPTRTK